MYLIAKNMYVVTTLILALPFNDFGVKVSQEIKTSIWILHYFYCIFLLFCVFVGGNKETVLNHYFYSVYCHKYIVLWLLLSLSLTDSLSWGEFSLLRDWSRSCRQTVKCYGGCRTFTQFDRHQHNDQGQWCCTVGACTPTHN